MRAMKTPAILLASLAAVLVLACEDKPKVDDSAKSAAASASAPPAASSAAPTASASAAPSATASASAAPAGSSLAPSKDVQITIKDPTAEPAATAKALVDGAVTLYLPETPGTSWTIPNADKSLGKAKEQTIPGFVGTTPAHQWVWQIKAPLKAGQTIKVALVNKKKKPDPGDKDTTFNLTIEIK
jgi:hypothetical protein